VPEVLRERQLGCVEEDPMTGLLVGSLLAYLGHRTGIARLYVLAVVSAVVGVTASAGPQGLVWGSAIYFSTMGAVFVASGALALFAYLRATA
jgi:hypothetical protein